MLKVKSIIAIIGLIIFGLSCSYGQQRGKSQQAGELRIAFYNVENLFDTIDDPKKDDAEFLPGAKNSWNSRRYHLKLDRIGEALAGMEAGSYPAVIGLCEVENRLVTEQLAQHPRLKKAGYSVIHHESPDERGIDNAIMVDPRQFRIIDERAISIDLGQFRDKTRDILYVRGVPAGARKDTLHLFVNHWPSRSEGKEKSEPKRILAAKTLKHAVDSILQLYPSAKIIIMGDFNDEPVDASITEILGAMPVQAIKPSGLYNLMMAAYQEGKGTLYWKDWDLFDQIIVSGQLLLGKKGAVITQRSGGIFDPDWLMFKTNDGEMRPNRTMGREYYGGYSDHFPVYIDLKLD